MEAASLFVGSHYGRAFARRKAASANSRPCLGAMRYPKSGFEGLRNTIKARKEKDLRLLGDSPFRGSWTFRGSLFFRVFSVFRGPFISVSRIIFFPPFPFPRFFGRLEISS
jgi:hypothetical protein